jgi:hypothetical protein
MPRTCNWGGIPSGRITAGYSKDHWAASSYYRQRGQLTPEDDVTTAKTAALTQPADCGTAVDD